MRFSEALPTLSAPFVRVWGTGLDGKVVAGLSGLAAALAGDLTVALVALLLLSGAGDWLLGCAAARRRGDFDRDVSRWGAQSKAGGIALVLLLRVAELALYRAGIHDPHGVFAAVVAAALFWADLNSIDAHRQTLGGRRIPILTTVLAYAKRASESLLPYDEPAPQGEPTE